MKERFPQSTNKMDWQEREGFTMVSDVAFKVVEDLSLLQPAPIDDIDSYTGRRIVESDIGDSAISLYLTSDHLTDAIPPYDKVKDGHYGVTRSDLSAGQKFAHKSGIAELGFTWHFAPALAKVVMDDVVDAGALEKSEVEDWTLTDWANVIGSGWFSRVAHSLAYTANGEYEQFGRQYWDYQKGSFKQKINRNQPNLSEDQPAFEPVLLTEPETGEVFTAARPSKPLVKYLRSRLAEVGNSTGCPVARISAAIPTSMATTDPHARNLINNNHAVINHERSNDTETKLRLDWSPIDATLAVLADKLESYEQLHGTPYISHDEPGLFSYSINHRTK